MKKMQHKIGVIPFDLDEDRIAIMFVTSQRRGRWILPKGNLLSGETHKKGCKREAFEEAGLKGKIITDLPITTVIGKSDGDHITRCEVIPLNIGRSFHGVHAPIHSTCSRIAFDVLPATLTVCRVPTVSLALYALTNTGVYVRVVAAEEST